jgi:hypothetical protein
MTGRYSRILETYDYKRRYELILNRPFSSSLCIQSLAREQNEVVSR